MEGHTCTLRFMETNQDKQEFTDGRGRSIVNMQKLVMGRTLCVMGSIFLAAGIRPRN